MKNRPNTVPAAVTLDLMQFCRRIADTVPVFVTSVPLRNSGASFCFDNVERKIAKSGGSIAYGWAIWHIPDLYYEAEHHAVWRNKLGSLIDVSPQLGGRRRLLFLPDESAVYDSWKPRRNIMLPANDTPLAIEMARLGGLRQELFAKCRIPGTIEMRFYEQQQLELADLNQRIENLMISAGIVAE